MYCYSVTKIYFLTVPWISCRIMECTKLSTTSEAYRYKCCSDHHLQRCTLLNVQLLCIMFLGRTMLVRLNSWWWNWQEWQADSKYAHGMGSNWCYGRLCKSWVGGFVGYRTMGRLVARLKYWEITLLSLPRQPPLNELGWRNLLQHLLTLRSRVFTCLDQAACYKVDSVTQPHCWSVSLIHGIQYALSAQPNVHVHKCELLPSVPGTPTHSTAEMIVTCAQQQECT